LYTRNKLLTISKPFASIICVQRYKKVSLLPIQLKQLQSVVDKGVAHGNSLEEEIKKLRDTTEKALKDKDGAQCSFDKDRAELCATLENYKVRVDLQWTYSLINKILI
jgi:hypothetical protein